MAVMRKAKKSVLKRKKGGGGSLGSAAHVGCEYLSRLLVVLILFPFFT